MATNKRIQEKQVKQKKRFDDLNQKIIDGSKAFALIMERRNCQFRKAGD